MPSSGAGGWRRKSEEYITNKSSALFTSRTGLKTKFHTKMVTIWFFPGKKGERRWHSTTAEARGTPRWPPFIVWVCVYTHSHCAYIGGTNRRWLWVWIYGGGVWGDLFEELMYALHKLFWAFFFILKKNPPFNMMMLHRASLSNKRFPNRCSLFFLSFQRDPINIWI